MLFPFLFIFCLLFNFFLFDLYLFLDFLVVFVVVYMNITLMCRSEKGPQRLMTMMNSSSIIDSKDINCFMGR